MATSLLALLDDITSLLDDVATISNVAVKKTAGVIGDDLALNAEQVVGFTADRELPVIWAVAKGALLNKVILVPAALLISAFIPKAILPLLMIGGLVLCFEGFEKVWHKLTHRVDDAAARAERLKALAAPVVDVKTLEKARVRGAVRTDFILSAEIVVIALGTMSTQPIMQQVLALSAVGLGVTVLVYGMVAGIVKLDDLGVRLQRDSAETSARYRIGRMILRGAPMLMRMLSILGTAAMFLVGGSIVVHGIPPLEHAVTAMVAASGAAGSVVKALLDAVVGIVAGGLIVGALTLGKGLRGQRDAQPAG
jgi:predicted DNA repair protein MutK